MPYWPDRLRVHAIARSRSPTRGRGGADLCQGRRQRLRVRLQRLGRHELTLEARERRQDDRDKRNLAAIVKAGITGETFRYTFARPLDEPLLWLPDTLAGMAGTRWSSSPGRTNGLHTDLFEEIALPPLPGQA